jgi:hypothetical protein
MRLRSSAARLGMEKRDAFMSTAGDAWSGDVASRVGAAQVARSRIAPDDRRATFPHIVSIRMARHADSAGAFR